MTDSVLKEQTFCKNPRKNTEISNERLMYSFPKYGFLVLFKESVKTNRVICLTKENVDHLVEKNCYFFTSLTSESVGNCKIKLN